MLKNPNIYWATRSVKLLSLYLQDYQLFVVVLPVALRSTPRRFVFKLFFIIHVNFSFKTKLQCSSKELEQRPNNSWSLSRLCQWSVASSSMLCGSGKIRRKDRLKPKLWPYIAERNMKAEHDPFIHALCWWLWMMDDGWWSSAICANRINLIHGSNIVVIKKKKKMYSISVRNKLIVCQKINWK